MKNKIIYFIIFLFLIVGIFSSIYLNKYTSNIEDTKHGNIINSTAKSEVNSDNLNLNLLDSSNEIKEDFNQAKLMVDGFKNLETNDDFILFEKKFGIQLFVFLAFKLKDLDLLSSYNKFYCTVNTCFFTTDEILELEKEIIKGLKSDGYYDAEYVNNGTYDYIFIPLLSKTFEEKINICKEGFSNKNDYNFCVNSVIYMESNKENKYCDKIENNKAYKELCEDTLELIN